MQWIALIRDVAEGVRRQPARTFLSFISLVIGMAALVILLSILAGVRQKTRMMISELGVNVFGLVTTDQTSVQTADPSLARRHADYLAANLADARVTGLRLDDATAAGLPDGTVLAATDEALFQVRPWRIIAGNAFDAATIKNREHCAVISASVAHDMGLSVGSDIRLHGMTLRITGIADIEAGTLEAGDARRVVTPGNRLVLVPWTIPAVWSQSIVPDATKVDALFIKSTGNTSLDRLCARTATLLQQPDYAIKRVSWVTPRNLVERVVKYQRIIMLAGGAIVVLCLVLGGITLTSLLLTGVQSRVPEIGLRRALGAAPSDIGLLFMFESILITLAATIIGTVLALILLRLMASWSPVPVSIGISAMTLPLLSGVLLGIVFSYWPARSAAGISPSEALRNE